ncbi:MFS transporter, partial [Klebsiella pneumoniae]|nr:MFS transporter [Klebsiella pneumoniae]
MSSIVIAGYALFCIIVFFLVNRLLRKKKTNAGEEQVPAVSKIEVSNVETEEKEFENKQEPEISNVVELETGKQEEVKQEKEVPKKQMSMPVENVNVKAVVAVLILGMFVSILNQTIINVALPPLMNEFNVSTSTAQWLITGF